MHRVSINLSAITNYKLTGASIVTSFCIYDFIFKRLYADTYKILSKFDNIYCKTNNEVANW